MKIKIVFITGKAQYEQQSRPQPELFLVTQIRWIENKCGRMRAAIQSERQVHVEVSRYGCCFKSSSNIKHRSTSLKLTAIIMYGSKTLKFII